MNYIILRIDVFGNKEALVSDIEGREIWSNTYIYAQKYSNKQKAMKICRRLWLQNPNYTYILG